MRRLTTVFVLAVVLCMAWITPAVNSQDPLPTIGSLFGYERPEKEDVVYFRNNDVLRGTILDEYITIATAYGEVKVALRKCAGMSFEGSTANTEAMVTVNFNRYTGIISNRVIKFKIGSSGEVIEVRKEKIKYVLLKRTADELSFIQPGTKTNMFVMTNGDLITGKSNPTRIVIRTDYADVPVGFDEIKEVIMQGGSQPTVQITKKNNDIMRGGLVTEEITLLLDIGTSIDTVYKDKFAKIIVDDGNEQAKALFGTAVTIIGASLPIVPLSPSVTMSSVAQDATFIIPGTDKTQLKMRLIPAGSFLMGTAAQDYPYRQNELPMHRVDISKPFYIGVYEITQAQWAEVMGTYPVKLKYSPNNPVSDISWEDCQRFISKINTMGIGTFRLPTEAEWEYACRAGSTTKYYWGNYNTEGLSKLFENVWYAENSNGMTHTVGQKKPNAWGLYDMCGNVWEFCSDFYGSYSAERQIDPKGPNSGDDRVIRGGSCNSNDDVFSALRWFHYYSSKEVVGFRIVREL